MRKRATERFSVKKRRSKDDATVSDEPEEEVSPKRRMSQTSMVAVSYTHLTLPTNREV